MIRQTVAITGAEGLVGHVLSKALADRGVTVVGVTHKPPSKPIEGVAETRVADLRDDSAVRGLFDGCNAVIHLAALPKPWEPWSAVYESNIRIDGNVFEEAVRTKLGRLVYGSSCHTVHGRSMGSATEVVRDDVYGRHLPFGKLHRLEEPPVPSSPYGAGKVLGEAMLRYHAAIHGLPCVAMRIGWLTEDDDPTAVGDKEIGFMRALYLSHRDAGEIFYRSLSAPMPDNDIPFVAAFASSNNGRSMLDLGSSEQWLNYRSVDDAEEHFEKKQGKKK